MGAMTQTRNHALMSLVLVSRSKAVLFSYIPRVGSMTTVFPRPTHLQGLLPLRLSHTVQLDVAVYIYREFVGVTTRCLPRCVFSSRETQRHL